MIQNRPKPIGHDEQPFRRHVVLQGRLRPRAGWQRGGSRRWTNQITTARAAWWWMFGGRRRGCALPWRLQYFGPSAELWNGARGRPPNRFHSRNGREPTSPSATSGSCAGAVAGAERRCGAAVVDAARVCVGSAEILQRFASALESANSGSPSCLVMGAFTDVVALARRLLSRDRLGAAVTSCAVVYPMTGLAAGSKRSDPPCSRRWPLRSTLAPSRSRPGRRLRGQERGALCGSGCRSEGRHEAVD
jgi:hypothetical protein